MVNVHLLHVFSSNSERERSTLVLKIMNLLRIDFAHHWEFMTAVIVISMGSKVVYIRISDSDVTKSLLTVSEPG